MKGMPRIVKKAEERKSEIVAAARELFKEKGYENVTMQELMDRLKIAKGTIYHHFASKDALLEAIVDDIVDEELRKKSEMLAGDRCKRMSAMEKMRLLITEGSISEDNDRILQGLHRPEHSYIHTKQLGRYIVKLAPLYASVIEQGCAEGIFSVERPLETAEFLLAGAQVLTDIGFYPWTEAELRRRAAALPSLLEAQLHAPAGSFGFLGPGFTVTAL